MKLIVETDVLKLHWVPEVHAAYGIWAAGSCNPVHAAAAYEQVQRLLVANKSATWISNSTAVTVGSPQSQQVAREWFATITRLRLLERWVIIPPESPTCRLMVGNLAANAAKCGIAFTQVKDLEEGCAWVAMHERGAVARRG